MTEKIYYSKGEYQFARLVRRVKQLCPNCTPGEIKHVSNLLGNKIRSLKYDVYHIDIETDYSRLDQPQYYIDEKVKWRHLTFYLRITVD